MVHTDDSVVPQMPNTHTPQPQQNHLLGALSEHALTRLRPQLELVSMPLGKVLYDSGDTMRHAYFPTDCIVSLLQVMENGASGEIAVVGNEGLVGIASFMGGESTPSRAIVQSAGSAYRLPGYQLNEEFNRHGEMMKLLLCYTQSLISQMSQTAACNKHHPIDQQLCRWLLLSLDRLRGNRMTMTQRLVSNMLGVGPEAVDKAAGTLEESGAITYTDGQFTVLDRSKLEQLCCECYAAVKNEAHRLCPYLAPVRTHPDLLPATA